MKENQIKLSQKPIIEHKLKEAGELVTKRIKELNLDKLVATPETVKSLKQLRSELNGELNNYEEQRKFIKNEIADPYKAFEEVYKVEISEKYKSAVEVLKEKIEVVENDIRKEKRENIKRYFDELCMACDVSFVTFEQLGLEINLSTSLKKYKEQTKAFIDKVVGEVELIGDMEHPIEMMAAYKQTLDAARAINAVRAKYKDIEEEKERIRIKENNRRLDLLKRLSFTYDEDLNTYVYSDSIYMSSIEVNDLTPKEFDERIIVLRDAIRIELEAPPLVEEVQISSENGNEGVNEEKKEEAIQTPPEPLKAPIEEKKEEIVKAQFEVTGTYPQLKKLSEYMKSNGINYKSLT